jgi:imidazoleglycerol-phosphate dehydratase
MLELFARHAAFDLKVRAEGDLEVDDHHTVEDVGICLGQALRQAWGRSGESAATAHDSPHGRDVGHRRLGPERTVLPGVSGRFPSPKIGQFDSELVEDFWQAVAANSLSNLHVLLHYGRNSHHISEAIFKGAPGVADGRGAGSANDRRPQHQGNAGRLFPP